MSEEEKEEQKPDETPQEEEKVPEASNETSEESGGEEASKPEEKTEVTKSPEESSPSLPAAIEEIENVGRILDLNVLVNVNIGTVKMNLKDVLALQPGAIIEVQKNIEDPLALSINNRKQVGVGEVVTIGESLGLRVVEKR